MNFVVLILTLAVIVGQLIRVPAGTHGGVTILDVSIIILCIFGLFKNRFRLKNPPPFLKVFFAFFLVCLLSLLLTPLHLTFQEYLSSIFYTFRLGFYVLLFWLIFSKAFGNLQDKIKDILLYSGIGLATLGLLQFLFLPNLGFLAENGWDPHYFRTVSTFLDPNFAGGFFVLTLLLIFQNSIPKKTRILFFIVVYLALLTTFSRSSYLMFLLSGFTLSFLNRSFKFFILVTILFLTLLAGFQIYTQAVAKPRNIDRGQSASFRLNTWQQGINLFEKSPILGTGYNSYRYAIVEYNLADNQFVQSHGASSNDSSLLTVLATTGVIGLTTYLLFLFALIKSSLKNNFILVAGVSGLLIHSFFANSLFYPFIFIWILLQAADTKH